MSLKALIDLANNPRKEPATVNGRVPCGKVIVGYSKGCWRVEYTFKTPGGWSTEWHWVQDARSIAHQQKFPND